MAAVAVVLLAGCSRSGGQEVGPGFEDVAATSPDAGPEAAAVNVARRMFADELDMDASSVVVLDVQATTWSDSSLGCPEAGQAYAQVLTPGYRIRVSTDGAEAVFHAGQRPDQDAPTVMRCDGPEALPGSAAFGGPALEAAVADLSSKVDEAPELDDAYVAPVTSLVCDNDEQPTPGPGPQKVILEFHLRAGDDVHVYRSWAGDIKYCGKTTDLAIQ